MPQYDATVHTASQRVNAIATQQVSGRRSEVEPGPNLIDLSQHPWVNRKADYFLYVFNTVNREFTVSRPPNFSRIVIPPCPPDRKYIVAMTIPNYLNTRDQRHDTGEQTINTEYGERFAMDIINPQNLSTQMWQAVNPKEDNAWIGGDGGDDLSRRGVFWTAEVWCEACGVKVASNHDLERGRCQKCKEVFYPKPSDEDLKRSSVMVRKFAQSRIERASKIAADTRSQDNISPEDHWAADFMMVSPTWHSYMAPPEFCENCGGQIRGDVGFHMNTEIGVMCIRDWQKAVEAGVKKMEDVPPGKQWWGNREAQVATPASEVEPELDIEAQRMAERLGESPARRGPGRPPKPKESEG